MTNKAALVQDILNDIRQGYIYVDHSLVGNELYVAFKHNEDVTIVLFLLRCHRGIYTSKSISEDSLPYYYKCPEKILRLSTSKTANSIEWKSRCRQAATEKKTTKDRIEFFTKTLSVNDMVLLESNQTVKYKYRLNNKYFVGELDGKDYKVPYNTASKKI